MRMSHKLTNAEVKTFARQFLESSGLRLTGRKVRNVGENKRSKENQIIFTSPWFLFFIDLCFRQYCYSV